jgi:hypothetical protein
MRASGARSTDEVPLDHGLGPAGSAALKETQDALAGPLDELLDILSAGCRRGVEHPTFAVAVGDRRCRHRRGRAYESAVKVASHTADLRKSGAAQLLELLVCPSLQVHLG